MRLNKENLTENSLILNVQINFFHILLPEIYNREYILILIGKELI